MLQDTWMGLKGLTNWIQREQVMKTHPFTLTNTKLRYKCSDPADMLYAQGPTDSELALLPLNHF